jgi:hypothetical protein
MQHSELFTRKGSVLKLDGWGLVVILKTVGVMFHYIYFRKFDSMALELNGDSHLPAWIKATHVAATATNASCRIR